MISFQNDGLNLILNNIISELQANLDQLQGNQAYLSTLINILYQCVSFNFSLSYFEYECEFEPSENNMITVKKK